MIWTLSTNSYAYNNGFQPPVDQNRLDALFTVMPDRQSPSSGLSVGPRHVLYQRSVDDSNAAASFEGTLVLAGKAAEQLLALD